MIFENVLGGAYAVGIDATSQQLLAGHRAQGPQIREHRNAN
jgi:hypothetical protein